MDNQSDMDAYVCKEEHTQSLSENGSKGVCQNTDITDTCFTCYHHVNDSEHTIKDSLTSQDCSTCQHIEQAASPDETLKMDNIEIQVQNSSNEHYVQCSMPASSVTANNVSSCNTSDADSSLINCDKSLCAEVQICCEDHKSDNRNKHTSYNTQKVNEDLKHATKNEEHKHQTSKRQVCQSCAAHPCLSDPVSTENTKQRPDCMRHGDSSSHSLFPIEYCSHDEHKPGNEAQVLYSEIPMLYHGGHRIKSECQQTVSGNPKPQGSVIKPATYQNMTESISHNNKSCCSHDQQPMSVEPQQSMPYQAIIHQGNENLKCEHVHQPFIRGMTQQQNASHTQACCAGNTHSQQTDQTHAVFYDHGYTPCSNFRSSIQYPCCSGQHPNLNGQQIIPASQNAYTSNLQTFIQGQPNYAIGQPFIHVNNQLYPHMNQQMNVQQLPTVSMQLNSLDYPSNNCSQLYNPGQLPNRVSQQLCTSNQQAYIPHKPQQTIGQPLYQPGQQGLSFMTPQLNNSQALIHNSLMPSNLNQIPHISNQKSNPMTHAMSTTGTQPSFVGHQSPNVAMQGYPAINPTAVQEQYQDHQSPTIRDTQPIYQSQQPYMAAQTFSYQEDHIPNQNLQPNLSFQQQFNADKQVNYPIPLSGETSYYPTPGSQDQFGYPLNQQPPSGIPPMYTAAQLPNPLEIPYSLERQPSAPGQQPYYDDQRPSHEKPLYPEDQLPNSDNNEPSEQQTPVDGVTVQDKAAQLQVEEGTQKDDIPDRQIFKTFCKQIVLASLVFLLFGGIMGFIAFIFALLANRAASYGNKRRADTFGKVSYAISFSGIIVGLVVVVVLVSVMVTNAAAYKSVQATFHPPPSFQT